MHGQFANVFDEVPAYEMRGSYGKIVGLLHGFETLAGGEFSKRAHVVGGGLQAGVRRSALGGDDDCGIYGFADGLGRTLEDGQEEFGFGRVTGVVLHLLGAIDPGVGDFADEGEFRAAEGGGRVADCRWVGFCVGFKLMSAL